jgi:succinate-acetate transporter protein
VGYFLLAFTFPTIIYTIAACKASGAHSLLFVTLLIGFICLDLSHLGAGSSWTTVAAIDLIVCGLTALYIMGAVVLGDFGMKLPMGKGWLAK